MRFKESASSTVSWVERRHEQQPAAGRHREQWYWPRCTAFSCCLIRLDPACSSKHIMQNGVPHRRFGLAVRKSAMHLEKTMCSTMQRLDQRFVGKQHRDCKGPRFLNGSPWVQRTCPAAGHVCLPPWTMHLIKTGTAERHLGAQFHTKTSLQMGSHPNLHLLTVRG